MAGLARELRNGDFEAQKAPHKHLGYLERGH